MRPALVRRVVAAQRALLSPVAAGGGVSEDAWASAVTAAVRAVSGCDHTLFVLPLSGSDGHAVRVYSDDSDPAAPAAVEAAFTGPWGGTPTWADRSIAAGYEARRRGGAGAYDERDLTPREVTEQSPVFQRALAPHGLRHALWLAAPLADGREFAVGAYYERGDDPRYRPEALAALSLLVPAFDAGVRAYLRHGPEAVALRAGFTAAIDALESAVLVVDEGGAEVHWNAACVRLLEPEMEDGRVLAQARQWARHLGRRRTGGAPPGQRVHGARGCYRVRGVRLEGSVGVGGVVHVERVGIPIPGPAALRERFGLTRREAEVARLLALGLPDRRIADDLSVAHATARRHTERVLRKLDVRSRAAVAACLCEEV